MLILLLISRLFTYSISDGMFKFMIDAIDRRHKYQNTINVFSHIIF